MKNKPVLDLELFLRHIETQFPGIGRRNAVILYNRYAALVSPPISFDSLDEHQKKVLRYTTAPCKKKGCRGTMFLEPVCPSCVEGKAGFNSSWTCSTCFLRELSKKDYSEWFDDAQG
jgi:hypothetical protein